MAHRFISCITVSLIVRILMTSLLWVFPIYGQTLEHTTNTSDGSITSSSDTNGTTYHNPCEEICDQTQPLGVFIGTFIGGAIVGALVAIVVLRCFYKNSRNAPPVSKDHDDLHQVRFDVNRKDNHLVSHEDEIIMEDQAINGHKKLERLVKPPIKAKPANFGGIATAATPLIHSTDSSSLDDATITSPSTTATTPPSNSESKSPKPSVPLKPSSSPNFKKRSLEKEDSAHTYEMPDGFVDYTNCGQNSPLTQPYDTLQIIAEEVEYINQPTHIYEAFKDKSQA